MLLPYRQKFDGCLVDQIGDAGLSEEAFSGAVARAWPGVEKLRAQHADNSLPFLRLPAKTDDIADIADVVAQLAGVAETLYVLGTGGSSLGGQTLCQLPGRTRRRVVFHDNIDPDGVEQTLADLVPEKSAVLVISKSGATPETLALYRVFWDAFLQQVGEQAAASRFRFITQPGDNVLRRLAAKSGVSVLDHDAAIGGRYTVLSLVGLIPALFHGLDLRGLRAGAAAVLSTLLTASAADQIAPAAGAGVATTFMRDRRISASVIYPYSDRLEGFARWYAQLWAESLGKNGFGSVPVVARGAVDQHSQLQLWLDGPADKMLTVLMLDWHGKGRPLAPESLDPDLAYMTGRTMGDLMDAEQRATVATLVRAGRPVRLLELDPLDEQVMGALLMHFMIETVLSGYILGVNPFDQPAVEHGKILTRKFLSVGA